MCLKKNCKKVGTKNFYVTLQIRVFWECPFEKFKYSKLITTYNSMIVTKYYKACLHAFLFYLNCHFKKLEKFWYTIWYLYSLFKPERERKKVIGLKGWNVWKAWLYSSRLSPLLFRQLCLYLLKFLTPKLIILPFHTL